MATRRQLIVDLEDREAVVGRPLTLRVRDPDFRYPDRQPVPSG